MLRIVVPIGREGWDEEKQEFVQPEERVLDLEHSLFSLSKWESKWCKSFLSSKEEKTAEEILDYIKCMTLTENVDPDTFNHLTEENISQIDKYMSEPMTATTFSDNKGGKGSREIVTAEVIFYWMISMNIPFECQYWHLGRLLTLIRVCSVKNTPPKKRSKRDIMNQNAALNAQRRARINSKG